MQAPTIASVLSERIETMRSSNVPLSQQSSDLSAFKTFLKPITSSQKSLEALNHEIKRALKEEAASLSDTC